MVRTLLGLLAAAGCMWAGAWWEEMRAGTGRVKITPENGTPMAGYFHERGSTEVHDELWARALVLESGGEKAALVTCDVIHLPAEVVQAARRLIEKETGLRAGAVMISATHAHTGPEVKGAYAEWLPARIAESVKLAAGSMKAARMLAGEGEEGTLTFNRRFWMTDGTVGWNPGKRNPRIVRPAGPVDARVGVVRVESEGRALATYVNYALHLDTVGGTEISADYPYTLERLVSGAMGGMTMFTLGCAGNLNHLDVSSAQAQKGHGEAERIGTTLAGEVIRTHAHLKKAGDGRLRASMETLQLPLVRHAPEEVAWARGVAAKYGKPNAAPFLELVKAMRVLAVEARQGRAMEAEVQVITVGQDVAFVGLPGEVFTELGLAIRERSPFAHTLVVSLANGHVGYVPDAKAWGEGNYEVVTSRCAEGSGERMVEAAVRMLKEARQ